MRLYVRATVFCLALILCAGAVASAQEWEKFSSADGGFSVLMPGKPKSSDQEIPSASGKLINHMYIVEFGQGAYLVTYLDFPSPITDPVMIKAMLDEARDKAIKATGAQLKEEKEIKLHGHPGREWFISLAGGLGRARAYWVNHRLYQALVLLPEGKDADGERAREALMAKFLDSFTLTSTAAGR